MAAKVDKLNIFLSNLAVINVKIHNLHWNVVGPNFFVVHKMTEKLYQMFQLQYDQVAEMMKMQNQMPLVTMAEYLDNTTIEEIEGRDYTDLEVLELLEADCQNIMALAKDIRDEADKKDNFLLANLLEEYLAIYAKKSWMLRAMLEGDPAMDDDDN